MDIWNTMAIEIEIILTLYTGLIVMVGLICFFYVENWKKSVRGLKNIGTSIKIHENENGSKKRIYDLQVQKEEYSIKSLESIVGPIRGVLFILWITSVLLYFVSIKSIGFIFDGLILFLLLLLPSTIVLFWYFDFLKKSKNSIRNDLRIMDFEISSAIKKFK